MPFSGKYSASRPLSDGYQCPLPRFLHARSAPVPVHQNILIQTGFLHSRVRHVPAHCSTDRICIRVFMTDYYGLMLVVLCHIGFLLSAVPPAHYLSIRHIFPNLLLSNPYFTYGQRKQVRRPADSLLPFYIITDFSLLCKTKSCTEYCATTVLFCSVQSAHKNIMYTRVFIIYLHGVLY